MKINKEKAKAMIASRQDKVHNITVEISWNDITTELMKTTFHGK